MTVQPGANLYTQGYGSRPENVEVPVISTRSPTSQDVKYPVGKRWINTTANSDHSLDGFSTSNGVSTAIWSAGTIVLAGITPPLVPDGGGGSQYVLNSPLIKTNSLVFLTLNIASGSLGSYYAGIVTAGSVNMRTNSASDTSTLFYIVVNP